MSGRIALLLTVALMAVATLGGIAGGAPAPDVASARVRLAELDRQEQALAARVGANRAELARLLGALELYGRDPPPALLISPADAKGAMRAAILIRAMTPALEARARVLSEQVRLLSLTRRRAAAASGELFAAESAVADRAGRLEGVTDDADLLAPPGGAPPPAGAAPLGLTPPTAGRVVVGYGGHLPDGAASKGIAIRASADAAVVSPAAALVDFAGPLEGWGKVLILRGAGGYHMVLSGLGRITVAAGAAVAAGEEVGRMAPGGGTTPELYFEVRLGGVPTDPARLLARAARGRRR